MLCFGLAINSITCVGRGAVGRSAIALGPAKATILLKVRDTTTPKKRLTDYPLGSLRRLFSLLHVIDDSQNNSASLLQTDFHLEEIHACRQWNDIRSDGMAYCFFVCRATNTITVCFAN